MSVLRNSLRRISPQPDNDGGEAKEKKKTSFAAKGTIRRIPNRLDYTDEERNSMWVTDEEREKLVDEYWLCVDLIAKNKLKTDTITHSMRGTELSLSAMQGNEDPTLVITQVVLGEQRKQRSVRKRSKEKIRKVSREVSTQHEQEAFLRACRDELAIIDYVSREREIIDDAKPKKPIKRESTKRASTRLAPPKPRSSSFTYPLRRSGTKLKGHKPNKWRRQHAPSSSLQSSLQHNLLKIFT